MLRDGSDSVLDRIALHQTRLSTPGLSLDGKGVALGAKAIVLLPTMERLVALLAVYCREKSLEDLLPSLAIGVVRSPLGTHEVTLECAAESSDRVDHIADSARLVGGLTFTGTSRHFVQYRDAAAPFGYDATQLIATEAAIVLYHDRFSQTYAVERLVDLRTLLLRLRPRPDATTKAEAGPRICVAENGLGPALVHYLVRSEVAGEVCLAEWPPESALDDAPVRRWIFRIPGLPSRMLPLLQSTPGIGSFLPAGPGVAVQAGFRHPIELRGCPVFDPEGLVLIRGAASPSDEMNTEPLVIGHLPPMGEIRTFARVELRSSELAPKPGTVVGAPPSVRVPLRLVPSTKPRRRVTATRIAPAEIPLLRRLAYSLPRTAVARTEIAVTSHGAWLRSSTDIDAIPLGAFFVEAHPSLYVAAGYDFVPSVSTDVLAQALDLSSSKVLFVGADARAIAIEQSAFCPLESLLLEAPPWEEALGEAIHVTLNDASIELRPTPIGMRPIHGVEKQRRGG